MGKGMGRLPGTSEETRRATGGGCWEGSASRWEGRGHCQRGLLPKAKHVRAETVEALPEPSPSPCPPKLDFMSEALSPFRL